MLLIVLQFVFVFVCLLGIKVAAVNADINFVDGKSFEEMLVPHMEQLPHITISGYISHEDISAAPDLLVRATKGSNLSIAGELVPFVLVDSPGGDVRAAITLGKMLRSVNAWIAIPRGGECSSACVLILAAGVKRSVFTGGRVGLHRPYFDEAYFGGLTTTEARVKYQEVERFVKGYLQEMGMPEVLFEKMRSIPSRRVEYLSEDAIHALSLDGTDSVIEELERAREKQHFANNPATYRYLQHLRNCFDSGTTFEACMEMARQEYKRPREQN